MQGNGQVSASKRIEDITDAQSYSIWHILFGSELTSQQVHVMNYKSNLKIIHCSFDSAYQSQHCFDKDVAYSWITVHF